MYFKVYLVEDKVTERIRGSEERDFPSTDSFLKYLQWPGLGQIESRNLKLHPGLSWGWSGPSIWAIFYCILWCGSKVAELAVEQHELESLCKWDDVITAAA